MVSEGAIRQVNRRLSRTPLDLEKKGYRTERDLGGVWEDSEFLHRKCRWNGGGTPCVRARNPAGRSTSHPAGARPCWSGRDHVAGPREVAGRGSLRKKGDREIGELQRESPRLYVSSQGGRKSAMERGWSGRRLETVLETAWKLAQSLVQRPCLSPKPLPHKIGGG